MLATALALAPIILWHAYSGGEEKAMQTLAQRWNSSATAARRAELPPVELVAIPPDRLADKLKTGIPRGHGPDLFIAAHDLIGEWARYGLLTPLEQDPILSPTYPGLLPQTLEPLRYEGHLWGVPLSFKSLVLFYRRDLIKEPPADTATLRRLCDEYKQAQQGVPALSRRYALAYDAGDYYLHAVWLHGFGGSLIPQGELLPRLNTPAAERSLNYAADLIRSQAIPDEMSAVLVAQFFNQGRAAMVINGPWFLGQISPGVPFGVAPLPILSETGRRAAPLTTMEAGFLNPRGRARAASSEFLRYLVSDEGSLVRALEGGQAVSTRATWQTAQVRNDPVLPAFLHQLDSVVPMPNTPEVRSFWEPANRALRQVLRGAEDAPSALRTSQRLLDTFLRPLPPRAFTAPYWLLLACSLLLGAGYIFHRARNPALRRAFRRGRTAYGYLLPTAITMMVLVFVPFTVGAGMSLFALTPDGYFRFVGLHNFLTILLCRESPILAPTSFYYTFLVTVLWTIINVFFHVLIGASLALLLRSPRLRLRGTYRTLLLVPWAVPNYITAMIWKGMFNRQFGAINGILSWLGLRPVSWFSSFWPALAANITTNVWLGFPFMMVVSLGVLAQIPVEVEEAARLDGANWWQQLRHVILPLLWPSLLPSVLLGAVWTFNMFNVVFLVSGGEPDGATDILVSDAYRWAFSRGHRYGYAAAYAVLIFGVLLIQSALMRRASDRASARG